MCCCAPTVELLVASWLAGVHAQNEALAAKDAELEQASAVIMAKVRYIIL